MPTARTPSSSPPRDALGNSSGQQFIWNVNSANLDPVLSNPGADQHPRRRAGAANAGDRSRRQWLDVHATGLPSGLTIDSSSGLISGVLVQTSALSGSPYTVIVTARTAPTTAAHVRVVGDESSGDGDQSRHAEQHWRRRRITTDQCQRSGAIVLDLCGRRLALGLSIDVAAV